MDYYILTLRIGYFSSLWKWKIQYSLYSTMPALNQVQQRPSIGDRGIAPDQRLPLELSRKKKGLMTQPRQATAQKPGCPPPAAQERVFQGKAGWQGCVGVERPWSKRDWRSDSLPLGEKHSLAALVLCLPPAGSISTSSKQTLESDNYLLCKTFAESPGYSFFC